LAVKLLAECKIERFYAGAEKLDLEPAISEDGAANACGVSSGAPFADEKLRARSAQART
jgi:hypothetical protein